MLSEQGQAEREQRNQAPPGKMNYSYKDLMAEQLGPGLLHGLSPTQDNGDQLLRGWPQTQLPFLVENKGIRNSGKE